MISAKNGKKIRITKGEGEHFGLGAAMVGIGDIDGDKKPDFVAGAAGAARAARSFGAG